MTSRSYQLNINPRSYIPGSHVYDSIAAGVIIHNSDGIIVVANKQAQELMGRTHNQLMGRTAYDQSWELCNEDTELLPVDDYPAVSVLRSGLPVHNQVISIHHSCGDIRWLLVSAEPVAEPDTGNMSHVVVTFVDITERKKYEEALKASEQRLVQLLDSAPFGAHVYDLYPDGRLLLVRTNRASTQILGVDCNQLLGKTIEEAFPPLASTSVPDAYRRVASTGEIYEAEQVDYQYGEIQGAYYVVAFQAAPNRVAAFFRDITETKKADEFRKRLETQKKQFYRDTILSVTQGKLEIVDSADIREYVEIAQLLIDIDTARHVGPARHRIEEFCRCKGLEGERMEAYLVGVGEAMANAVKHGNYGQVYAGEKEAHIWTCVVDKGTGINSLVLPQAVLKRGFSTKASLGLGYSIMLEVADRILLKTDEFGTSVIQMIGINPEEPHTTQIPDTW